MARNWLLEEADKVDASVFSGDAIMHKETLKEFKEYVERWTRKIKELEETPEMLRDEW